MCGHGGHLGHGTSIMSSDFHFLVFIKKQVHIGTVSEKIRFDFLYVPDLGPRSRNDLDLEASILTYLHIFNKMTASTNFQVTGCNSF